MNEILYIIIAAVVVAAVGCPFAEAYSRWKKAEKNEREVD